MAKPVPKIMIGNREYSRFIQHPALVRDRTVRCVFCGQIDESPYHLEEYCSADGKKRYGKDHPA